MQAATNAELTRRGFELWNERRIEDLLELYTEDTVWDMRPFGIPDMNVFHGHEGVRRFFDEWLQAFPDALVEIEEVQQQGDWTLSLVLQHAIGGASGTPVPFRYAGIGHWTDGRLDFVQNHTDLDRARAEFAAFSRDQPARDPRPPARQP